MSIAPTPALPAVRLSPTSKGAIEQDADIVLFIYREEEYRPSDQNRGLAEIIIGKQRNGPTGSRKLAFIKELTRFENLEWRGGPA